jgi:hypothetical protein
MTNDIDYKVPANLWPVFLSKVEPDYFEIDNYIDKYRPQLRKDYNYHYNKFYNEISPYYEKYLNDTKTLRNKYKKIKDVSEKESIKELALPHWIKFISIHDELKSTLDYNLVSIFDEFRKRKQIEKDKYCKKWVTILNNMEELK